MSYPLVLDYRRIILLALCDLAAEAKGVHDPLSRSRLRKFPANLEAMRATTRYRELQEPSIARFSTRVERAVLTPDRVNKVLDRAVQLAQARRGQDLNYSKRLEADPTLGARESSWLPAP